MNLVTLCKNLTAALAASAALDTACQTHFSKSPTVIYRSPPREMIENPSLPIFMVYKLDRSFGDFDAVRTYSLAVGIGLDETGLAADVDPLEELMLIVRDELKNLGTNLVITDVDMDFEDDFPPETAGAIYFTVQLTRYIGAGEPSP